jgi:hypothetical protein
LTFVVGIKALLLIVAAFYCAALLTRPKSESNGPTDNLRAAQSDPSDAQLEGAPADHDELLEAEPISAC